MRLNLGCNDDLREGWINVDICEPPHNGNIQFQQADLTQPWPWEADSVREVFARDIFEHLPDRIQTMNELWRILVPGGKATIIVPSAAKGAGFAQDPTHKSAWCMNSFQYYRKGSFAHGRLAKSYGFQGAFNVVSLSDKESPDEYETVWKVTAVLEAVK